MPWLNAEHEMNCKERKCIYLIAKDSHLLENQCSACRAVRTCARLGAPTARPTSSPCESRNSVVGVDRISSFLTSSNRSSASISICATPGISATMFWSKLFVALHGVQNTVENCTSVALAPSGAPSTSSLREPYLFWRGLTTPRVLRCQIPYAVARARMRRIGTIDFTRVVLPMFWELKTTVKGVRHGRCFVVNKHSWSKR